MQLDEILERQQRSWNDNDPVSIENLLLESPELRERSGAIVDLIYAEILLREARGEHPSKEEYVVRFPKLTDSIERQFQVHRALQPSSEAEVLTDAGGETLAEDGNSAAAHFVSLPAVPGFELTEMLGRGGSGVAWQARDLKLDRTVAIKFLLDSESEVNGVANSERLSREAAAAANLLHPSIVQVYQVGEAEGIPFLVMEYVDGGSLAQKLRSGPLPTEKSVELAATIAEAVQHAHEKGIIHRDIKPGNILLSPDGNPRVCDFGLARKMDAEHSLHKTGDVLGTPAYMSPEQAQGGNADVRSDVYSIGAVLYESLCGRSPFQAAHPWEILYQVTTTDPLPLTQLNPSAPVELETICQKCLDKNPDRRYQKALELADDLKRFAEGKPIKARPVSMLGRFSKWCRRNKAVASLAAVSLLLLSTLAIGSTVAVFKLSASNEKILEEQRLASAAEEKAINDRMVAVDSLYTLVNSVFDKLESEMLPLKAQEEIAIAAIVGLRKISAIEGDAASIKTAILSKKRIGEIQAQRGKNELAMIEFEEALEMAREFQQLAPDDFDHKKELASTINYLAKHCIRIGEFEKAETLVLESNLLLDELLLEQPNNRDILDRWVVARSYEIDGLWKTQPPQKSIELGLQCLNNVERLYEQSGDVGEGLRTVNQFYLRLGRAYNDASILPEADKYFELARKVISEAIEKFPDTTWYRTTSAVTNKIYGISLKNQGRFAEAKTVYDSGVEDANYIVSLDPENFTNKVELANIRALRSALLTALGDFPAAIEDLEFGAAVYEEKLKLNPGEVTSLHTLLTIYVQMIDLQNRGRRTSHARNAAVRVIEILDREDMADHPSEQQRWNANLNINAIDAIDGKPLVDPSAEDRALGLFFAAFLFSDRSSDDSLDEEAIQLVRSMEPESTFATVSGLFEYSNSLPLTHPLLKQLLPMMEARIYARQAALLDDSNSKSEADKARLEDLKTQCVDLLVPLSKLVPMIINEIYLEPDFIWLRSTDTFAEAGLLLKGAD